MPFYARAGAGSAKQIRHLRGLFVSGGPAGRTVAWNNLHLCMYYFLRKLVNAAMIYAIRIING
jgi:hypothetical protein